MHWSASPAVLTVYKTDLLLFLFFSVVLCPPAVGVHYIKLCVRVLPTAGVLP